MEWQLWFLLFTLHSCSAHDTLHKAAYEGNLDLVKRLLERGADINQQNEGWLYTPLHYAAYYGRAEVVRYLLSLGASKTIGDNEGDTALDAISYPECDLNYNVNPNCKKAPVNYAETVSLLTAECISSIVCPSYLSCVNQKCVNLCLGFCGVNADCRVKSHQPICTCKSGYSAVAGTGCQQVCSRQCLNGKCASPNICQCNQGWTGNLCQTPVCSPQCLNGDCEGPNICQCKQGWTGNLCQTRSCLPPFKKLPETNECFYVSKKELSWENARGACQRMGGDLAVPKDFPALHKLLSTIPNEFCSSCSWFYVGGNDRASPGIKHSWINGEVVAGVPWRGSNPDLDQKDNCLLINHADGKLADSATGCGSTVAVAWNTGYICQK